jgi:hypothetical protein
MSAHINISSDILSTLVEVDFDKAYVVRMMAESPDDSLFYAIYNCLYSDSPPELTSAAQGA